MILLSVLLALSVNLCEARLYESADQIPCLDAYTYVVTGGGVPSETSSGGIGGSVLTNRLTEEAQTSVLLIEAGSSNQGVLAIEVPGLQSFTGNGTIYNWNYTTIPQSPLGNMTLPVPRGHVLGGSSSINGMWYARGSSADYDRWGSVIGDEGWSWDEMQYYFKKSEMFVPPADKHNTSGQYYSQPLNQLAIDRLDSEFPFVEDYQDGQPLGVGWTQTTIRDGARSNAAAAYLLRISRDQISTYWSFFASRNDIFLESTKMYVKAKNEVLLCAGTINTPHILLNFGIGDKDALLALNITPLIPRSTPQSLTSGTLNILSRRPYHRIQCALSQWNETRTGRLVMAVGNNVGWRMNTSDPAVESLVNQYGDPAPGPFSPHIELLPTVNAFNPVQNFEDALFIMDAVVLTPNRVCTTILDIYI
ncbi:hypothetical protein B0H10DRAFT_1948703 [Mycena sp. CBHHK59/15]|nr:hypothetical protein B0H10DRAFT_1948703 [Mycena sp. CBHHK59/15]